MTAAKLQQFLRSAPEWKIEGDKFKTIPIGLVLRVAAPMAEAARPA